MKKTIFFALLLSLGYTGIVQAYKISIKNELDGFITVNITENNVTTPRSVGPGKQLDYQTVGCYTLTLRVESGNAQGQTGLAGTDAVPYCDDYQVIARFSTSRYWDPTTGKESQTLVMMELVSM